MIVTTSKSILRVDIDSGKISVIERGHGLYYGIAIKSNRIYVGARNRVVTSSEPSVEEIRIFEDDALIDTLRHPSLLDIHSIAWVGDSLWVTSTGRDEIAIFEPYTCSFVRPFGKFGTDVHHVNSILDSKDSVMVLAHNKGNPSEIFTIDKNDLSQSGSVRLGIQSHNIWFEGDVVFTCSSGEGCILGSDGTKVHVGGFPRGVVTNGPLRHVGISPIEVRDGRDSGTPYILAMSDNWIPQYKIHLPDEGQILDIHQEKS